MYVRRYYCTIIAITTNLIVAHDFQTVLCFAIVCPDFTEEEEEENNDEETVAHDKALEVDAPDEISGMKAFTVSKMAAAEKTSVLDSYLGLLHLTVCFNSR